MNELYKACYTRREELQSVFPDGVYSAHLQAATKALAKFMEAERSDNPISSAITAAKMIQGEGVREDTARQFFLIAGLGLAEASSPSVATTPQGDNK